MTKRFFAIICGTGLLVIFAGCGSGGSSSGSASSASSTSSAASVSTPVVSCAKVTSAKAQYVAATALLGRKGFFNKSADLGSRASTQAFKRSVEGLPQAGTDGEIKRLVQALSQQEKLFVALAAHDLAGVRKFGNELNVPLEAGLKSLSSVCAGK